MNDLRDPFTQQHFNDKSTVESHETVKIAGQALNADNLIRLGGAPDGSQVKVLTGDLGPLIEVDHPFFATPAIRQIYEGEHGMGLYLYNDMFILRKEHQQQGLGARCFAIQVNEAKALGFTGIALYAGGSPTGQLNGYYTWPRLGFNMELPPNLRSSLPSTLSHIKDLQGLMVTSEGQAWWRANGIDGDMEFDLTDGSPSLKILSKYLEEKGIKL